MAQVSIDFDDWAWNQPLARCTATHDWTAVGELRRTFLDAAVVGLSRAPGAVARGSNAVRSRTCSLLHLSAIDAEMLDCGARTAMRRPESAGFRSSRRWPIRSMQRTPASSGRPAPPSSTNGRARASFRIRAVRRCLGPTRNASTRCADRGARALLDRAAGAAAAGASAAAATEAASSAAAAPTSSSASAADDHRHLLARDQPCRTRGGNRTGGWCRRVSRAPRPRSSRWADRGSPRR